MSITKKDFETLAKGFVKTFELWEPYELVLCVNVRLRVLNLLCEFLATKNTNFSSAKFVAAIKKLEENTKVKDA